MFLLHHHDVYITYHMFYDTLSAPPCFIVYLICCDHCGVVAGGDERQELLPDLASYGALQETRPLRIW